MDCRLDSKNIANCVEIGTQQVDKQPRIIYNKIREIYQNCSNNEHIDL